MPRWLSDEEDYQRVWPRTLRSNPSIYLGASRSESHLLVVTILRDDPDTDKAVAVATSRVVDVTGDAVLLTTVVLTAGAAAQSRVAGFELTLGVGLVAGAVTSPYTVTQYRE